MHARLSLVLVAAVAVTALVAGCSGSSGDASPPASTTKFVVNPLEPGHGVLQLGPNQYPFDGVICADGPLASDPKDTIRDFGVYANFTLDGSLVAVSMTRYVNRSAGAVPTITDTAQVQMQGKGEVKGLKAQRARIVGNPVWGDVFDPTAKGPLIVKTGDRYDAKGTFGAPDSGPMADTGTGTTTTSTTTPGTDDTTPGELSARCPAASAATSTSLDATSTTAPAGTSTSLEATNTTVPAPDGAAR